MTAQQNVHRASEELKLSLVIESGLKRKNMKLSLQALVCHYFEGCICYHNVAAY